MGINLQKDYEAFCLIQKKGGLTATEFTELCNAMLFYLGIGNRSKATDEQHLVYTMGEKSFAVKCICSNRSLDKRTVDAFMVDPVIGYKKRSKVVYYIITNVALSDKSYDLAEKNNINVIDKTSFNLILNIAVGNYNKAVEAVKVQKAKYAEIKIPDVESPFLQEDEDTDECDYRTNSYTDELEEDDGLSMEEIDFFESDIYDDE